MHQRGSFGDSMTVATAQHGEQAALRGVPSLVWRAGQDRRLSLIRQWSPLDGAKALVDGCGVGMYVRALQQAGAEVWGLDIEHEHAIEAAGNAPGRASARPPVNTCPTRTVRLTWS